MHSYTHSRLEVWNQYDSDAGFFAAFTMHAADNLALSKSNKYQKTELFATLCTIYWLDGFSSKLVLLNLCLCVCICHAWMPMHVCILLNKCLVFYRVSPRGGKSIQLRLTGRSKWKCADGSKWRHADVGGYYILLKQERYLIMACSCPS